VRAHIWFVLGLLVASMSAHAHGGGLDKNGCHHDRKHGGYHCHGVPRVALPPQAVPPVAPAPGVAAAAVPSTPTTPTCHVGPCGGTYTITASGRKTYKGC
jgi:hypothetical protein